MSANKSVLPKVLEEQDLATRQRLVERRNAIVRADAELDGAWAFWREGINARYSMKPEDYLLDDGTIVRVDDSN